MLDLPAVVVVVALVASAMGFACTTAMMGNPVAVWLLLGLYVVLGGVAIARMWRDGTLLDLFRWRSGDIALGFATALLLVAGAYAGRRLLVPPGSPGDVLVVRLYAQLGELPKERGAYALATVTVALTALLEELTWRGLVQQVLEERLGHRRGWLLASGLYALAHTPTLVLLAMPGIGWNPLVVMAALGCGLVWGFWVGRLQRLAPSLVSHALFTWVMVLQLRLLPAGGRIPGRARWRRSRARRGFCHVCARRTPPSHPASGAAARPVTLWPEWGSRSAGSWWNPAPRGAGGIPLRGGLVEFRFAGAWWNSASRGPGGIPLRGELVESRFAGWPKGVSAPRRGSTMPRGRDPRRRPAPGPSSCES